MEQAPRRGAIEARIRLGLFFRTRSFGRSLGLMRWTFMFVLIIPRLFEIVGRSVLIISPPNILPFPRLVKSE